MRVTTAQLPPMDESDDKIFVTPQAVVMLDGASAFVPVPVPAADYADYLGRHMAASLTGDPTADLPDVLAEAIRDTASHFDLHAGESPSSTVTIARERGEHLDLLLLGDNTVILPDGEILTDDRMDRLDLEPRRKYRERLAAGYGYDDEHRALLRELQTQQAELRNRDGGYWIAETDPAAAQHGFEVSRPVNGARWAILATDGAYNTSTHIGLSATEFLKSSKSEDLESVLVSLRNWEQQVDPDAAALPRAKNHDDKSIAVIRTA